MKFGLAILVALVLGIGALAVLGGGNNGPTRPTGHLAATVQPAAGRPSSSNDSKVQLAPDFSLKGLDGQNISLTDYRGQRPVVLDFWASWCPNCQRDMPKLNQFYEKYKEQVAVIGINLQENEKIVRDFISRRQISFPIALDPAGRASDAYGIRYTNSHILIGKDGQLIRVIPGDIREQDILDLIKVSQS